MKTHLQVSLLLIVLIAPSALQAQLSGPDAPDSLLFQGSLTDPGGAPVDTTIPMTFKLYKGGTQVWTETHPAVVVAGGVFTVPLGSVTPLDTVAFNQQIELGMTVGGDPEMAPRGTLMASAFALGMRGMYAVWAEDGDDASYNVIAGASNNMVGPGVVGATIGGGGGTWNGTARPNSVTGLFGTIGGGGLNTSGALFATVGGGFSNAASGVAGTAGGGQNNVAGGESATVGGGVLNMATGSFTTVGGGSNNVASGQRSTVPGGWRNAARGDYSFAAGYNSRPQHEGSFVWADRSLGQVADSFSTTGVNQFLIRAAGGVGIGTNAPTSQLTVNGMIESESLGFKFPDGSVQTSAAGAGAFWSLAGNAGTTPGTDFIGTTDSTAFEVRINGTRRLRIEPAVDGTSIAPNIIAGGSNNSVTAGVVGATIGGGGGTAFAEPRPNSVTANFGTVGGGGSNTASALLATVGGGGTNTAGGDWATVGGGSSNTAAGTVATVPGGGLNAARGDFSFAAGSNARPQHEGSFVWADRSLTALADSLETTGPNQFLIRAAGGVGIGTNAPASQLTVNGMIESESLGFKFPDGSVQTSAAGGGSFWSLAGNAGTSPGTDFIGTTDSTAFEVRINGTRRLRIEPSADGSTVAPNMIAGASNNSVSVGVVGATIGGGGGSIIGNPSPHRVSGDFGTVGGGHGNTAGQEATIGGGSSNSADGLQATVGGGGTNTASGSHATVGGGVANTASGPRATVGGGENNEANGVWAAVPGGNRNAARGDYSFAAGFNARPQHQHEGSFVWADRSLTGDADSLETTGPNQFLIRAAGGVGIGTNAPNTQLSIVGDADFADNVAIGKIAASARLDIQGGNFDLNATEGDIRVGTATNRLKIGVATGGGGAGRAIIRAQGTAVPELRLGAEDTDVVIINKGDGLIPTVTNTYTLGKSGNVWTEVWATDGTINTSDRRLKEDIRGIGYGLDEILQLMPVAYRWKNHPENGDKIGLIAQDVDSVVPEVVRHGDSAEDMLGLNYAELVPVLIKAIQEQQETIEGQSRRLAVLEARMTN